jgi:hypothetical protein
VEQGEHISLFGGWCAAGEAIEARGNNMVNLAHRRQSAPAAVRLLPWLLLLHLNGCAEAALQSTSFPSLSSLPSLPHCAGSLVPRTKMQQLLGHRQQRRRHDYLLYYSPRISSSRSGRCSKLDMVVGDLASPQDNEFSPATTMDSALLSMGTLPAGASPIELVDDAVSGSSMLPVDYTATTTLAMWQRRLITSEDPWSVHKWASMIYTVTSVVILGTGATRWMAEVLVAAALTTTSTPEGGTVSLVSSYDPATATTGTLPDSLAPWAVAYSLSNVVMCLASVRLSFLHRQGDLTARNAFLGTAVSSLFSGFFFLWVSPFAPTLFDNNIVSRGCFAILLLLNTVFIVDTLVKVPEVVEGRRDRKAEPTSSSPLIFARDGIGYVLPIAWGLPVIGATGYQAALVHDRQWFLDYCHAIQTTTGFPFLASTAYLQVLASLAASYGALFVTLRDKKLITKRQELLGITVFSVPAMIWTIYVTLIFYQNLDAISS